MSGLRNYRVLSIIWAFVIFITSSTVILPKAFIHSVSSIAPAKISEPGFEVFWGATWWVFVKGYHMLEFAILTFLLAGWFRKSPLWVPALIAILYATVDEVHQLWVPRRGGHLSDVLIDSAGVLIACAFLAKSRIKATTVTADSA